MAAHPFDAAAPGYDEEFTSLQPGRWFRDRVWACALHAFQPGGRILDLGCGTGEDAVWMAGQGFQVSAMDISEEMLHVARRKGEEAGLSSSLSFFRGDLSHLSRTLDERGETFDGVLSNFGPLNCVESLAPTAEALAQHLRPGGTALLVIMGPWCPWEIKWYLLHGKVKTAFRRFKSPLEAPVGGGAFIKTWYHSPGKVHGDLKSCFQRIRTVGLGAILPPPYLSGLVKKAPRFFRFLASLDRALGPYFPFSWLNDHFLVEYRVSREGEKN